MVGSAGLGFGELNFAASEAHLVVPWTATKVEVAVAVGQVAHFAVVVQLLVASAHTVSCMNRQNYQLQGAVQLAC